MQINNIRALYSESAKNSQKAQELYNYLSKTKIDNEALLLAYFAASEALKAKNIFMVFSKLAYLQSSKKNFQKAINLDLENPEIRFLRFSIEHSLPLFLGMSGHLNEDKRVILKNLKEANIPEELRQAIAKFLLNSGRCLSKEKDFLVDFLN